MTTADEVQLSNGWYWHQQYRLITMVRGSLVAVIYSKTMRIELVSASASEATTLMSADVERIATGLRGMHELWAMMLEVGVGFWLLYRQVGLAMLSMAGLTLGLTTLFPFPMICVTNLTQSALLVHRVLLDMLQSGRRLGWRPCSFDSQKPLR